MHNSNQLTPSRKRSGAILSPAISGGLSSRDNWKENIHARASPNRLKSPQPSSLKLSPIGTPITKQSKTKASSPSLARSPLLAHNQSRTSSGFKTMHNGASSLHISDKAYRVLMGEPTIPSHSSRAANIRSPITPKIVYTPSYLKNKLHTSGTTTTTPRTCTSSFQTIQSQLPASTSQQQQQLHPNHNNGSQVMALSSYGDLVVARKAHKLLIGGTPLPTKTLEEAQAQSTPVSNYKILTREDSYYDNVDDNDDDVQSDTIIAKKINFDSSPVTTLDLSLLSDDGAPALPSHPPTPLSRLSMGGFASSSTSKLNSFMDNLNHANLKSDNSDSTTGGKLTRSRSFGSIPMTSVLRRTNTESSTKKISSPAKSSSKQSKTPSKNLFQHLRVRSLKKKSSKKQSRLSDSSKHALVLSAISPDQKFTIVSNPKSPLSVSRTITDMASVSAEESMSSLSEQLSIETLAQQLTITDILTNDHYRSVFHRFCQSELSTENIDFWNECVQYEKWSNKKQRLIHAKKVYAEYICPKSPNSLNIDMYAVNRVRNRILACERKTSSPIDDNLKDLLKSIKSSVEVCMTDTYHRFKASKLFKEMLIPRLNLSAATMTDNSNTATVNSDGSATPRALAFKLKSFITNKISFN